MNKQEKEDYLITQGWVEGFDGKWKDANSITIRTYKLDLAYKITKEIETLWDEDHD